MKRGGTWSGRYRVIISGGSHSVTGKVQRSMTGNHILYTTPECRITQSNNVYSITSLIFFIKYTSISPSQSWFTRSGSILSLGYCASLGGHPPCKFHHEWNHQDLFTNNIYIAPSASFQIERAWLDYSLALSLSPISGTRATSCKSRTLSSTELNALPRALAAYWPTDWCKWMGKPGSLVGGGSVSGDYACPKGFTLEKGHVDQCNTARRHPNLPFRHQPYLSLAEFREKRLKVPRRNRSLLFRCQNRTWQSSCYYESFLYVLQTANAVGAILLVLTTMTTHLIAYFLPTILEKSTGFSVAKAQCSVAPPWAGAAVVMFICTIYSDKWHAHSSVLVENAVVELVGLEMLGYLEHLAPCVSSRTILTFHCPSNIHGQWKRAFTSTHSSAKAVSGTLLG